MIDVQQLTKRYGSTVAVRDLSFTVRAGTVTGFLGPNGSGKSTTLRVLLGLDRPSSGTATIGGRPYRELPAPLREVGATLDARAVHPGRTGRDHLRALARSNRIRADRVSTVLELVGLDAVADRRAGALSLGMSQRLGIAAALLGDPAVVVLDEPMDGLDTEGIRWLRGLAHALAAEGRTVFLSSHVMSEVELTASDVVVIGRGRLLAAAPMVAFIEAHSTPVTLVRSPDAGLLRAALTRLGADVEPDPGGALLVRGPSPAAIGDLADRESIVLHELAPVRSSLEDVYSELTAPDVEYAGAA